MPKNSEGSAVTTWGLRKQSLPRTTLLFSLHPPPLVTTTS
jgi:hypothetical protein